MSGRWFAATRSRIPRLPVKGRIADQAIDTFADSEIAKYYLEHYLTNDGTDTVYRTAIDAVNQNSEAITREYLKQLSDTFSPDFATLLFAHRLLNDRANRELQQHYRRELAILQQQPSPAEMRQCSTLVVFVPGFNYRSRPNTGADFARPRAILDRIGIRNRLLDTEEHGTIEANAAIIAATLSNIPAQNDVIIVSASKAGPETALALRNAKAAARVSAWVNICGMLYGTPRADAVLRSPLRRLAAKAYFLARGWDFRIVEDLATGSSRARMRGFTLPPHVFVVNFVGFPLSGDVTALARPKYEYLRQCGPNDGLTLLVDGILPGGVTLVELGVDHYFRGGDIEVKTVALIRTVIACYSSCIDGSPPQAG
jgi:hypothetical protein